MEEGNKLAVDGYIFGTAEDAETARQEAGKVAYLEKNMDCRNKENMLAVYQKAIEKRIFCTPVGWEYLRKLQRSLSADKELQERIPLIPLYTVFDHSAGKEKRTAPVRQTKKKGGVRRLLRLSMFLNILLAVAVCAMFYIAMTDSHPNILNYEKALVDKYAAWEQELKGLEGELRERERQLSGE